LPSRRKIPEAGGQKVSSPQPPPLFAREPKRSPAAPRLGRGSRSRKNFLFLLEKNGARKNQKCKENFSARQCRFAARRRGEAIE